MSNLPSEKDLFDGFTIVACVPYSYTHVYVLQQLEEQDLDEEYALSQLLVYRIAEKTWSLIEELEGPEFEDMAFTPDNFLLLLGQDGEIISYQHKEGELQLPNKEYDLPVDTSYKALRVVEDCTYAVGVTRTVLRSQVKGQWMSIDQSTHTNDMKKKGNLKMGFLCIDGFNSQDIYVSGYNTDTWHYKSEGWQRIDLPTSNITIESVLCTPDGNIYLAGDLGCLIKGRGDHWQSVESNFINKHKEFGNLTWFNDNIYFCSKGTELFRIDQEENLQPVYEISPLASFTAGVMKANEHMMIVCGVRTVRLFDGKDWRVLANY